MRVALFGSGSCCALWFGLLLLLACPFLADTCPAGECYVWTDAEGQVHITTSAPPLDARKVTVRHLEDRPKTTTPKQSSVPRTVVAPSPSRPDRVTSISPASIKLEQERLQAEIIRLEQAKQKSSSELGISKYDRNGYEKMRAHQERCDQKIREFGRRMGELRRDPVRYAYKYQMIIY